jgi:hypothetical protein
VYPIPAGNQGLAVVDVRDIAEAAAISLIEEGYKGQTARFAALLGHQPRTYSSYAEELATEWAAA